VSIKGVQSVGKAAWQNKTDEGTKRRNVKKGRKEGRQEGR
jgi:hypothetical protein